MIAVPAAAPPAVAPLPRIDRRLVEAQAYGLGFDLVGVAPLGPVATAPAFERWLDAGHAGEMHYLARGAEKRRDARLPVPGATHAIVVALDYGGREASGPVARYARGADYHDLMVARLRALQERLGEHAGAPVAGRAYVDTGPLLERDLARRAGLGWFGKSTMLIHPRRGSFFFLGALLVAAELEASAPFEEDRCGTCTRCLDACPTGALVGPRELDATRCVSYLTIEAKGAIPAALRPLVGELLYGCDVCQDVCPYTRKFSHELKEAAFAARPAIAGKDARTLALELLAMSQPEFSAAFRGSPMKRAKLRGLKRNAAVVLGNVGSPADVPALVAALSDDEPLARGHAAWALGRVGASDAVEPMRARLREEPDAWVRSEIEFALQSLIR